MKKELRDYQAECLQKIEWSMGLEGNDLVGLPTGAGKSVVIANLANNLNTNILIVQPSQEILLQNVSRLKEHVEEDEIGIYSASLKEAKIAKYTFATIGSIYKKPELFKGIKLVIVDECHLINFKNDGSMFMTFLNDIGKPKVIGFSATLYRLTPTYFVDYDRYGSRNFYQANSIKLLNRMLDKKDGDKFWDRIVYNMDLQELINRKYLTPLEYIDRTIINQEIIPLNKSGTDFDLEAYDQMVSKIDFEAVKMLREVITRHNHILVFCNSVAQAERMKTYFENSECVSSNTTQKDRVRVIDGFKNGEYKMVFNVGVLTTGFDMPALDCIVLMRPTRSLALYYQMVGRGLRLSEGKEKCYIYDWSGVVKQLGRVETIQLKKIPNERGTLMWNVVSETKPNGWQGIELYRFVLKELTPKKEKVDNTPSLFDL